MEHEAIPSRRVACRPNPDTGVRGFTLFEMLIGLAVMSIMGMIAIPRLVSVTEDYRLDALAREVTGNITNARILSITHNADYRVIVSGTDTYILQEDVSGTWTDRESYTMPEGFTIGDDGDAVEFHRWGNASPVATFDITNENSNVVQVVTATSGRSYVQ